MAAQNDARLALDRKVSKVLRDAWDDIRRARTERIASMLDDRRFADALQEIDKFDLSKAVAGHSRLIKTVADASFILGASQLGNDLVSTELSPVPAPIRNASKFFAQSLEISTVRFKERLRNIVEQARDEHDREQDRLYKAFSFDTVDQILDSATQKTGFAGIDIAGSLMNSRMANYGFTVEADLREIQFYQIRAILDSRTGDLDRLMNGRVFPVEVARRSTEQQFSASSAEELAQIAPFPSQKAVDIARYRNMTGAEMFGAGLHLPPYHPYCRCVIIPTNRTVELDDFPIEAPDNLGGPFDTHVGLTRLERLSRRRKDGTASDSGNFVLSAFKFVDDVTATNANALLTDLAVFVDEVGVLDSLRFATAKSLSKVAARAEIKRHLLAKNADELPTPVVALIDGQLVILTGHEVLMAAYLSEMTDYPVIFLDFPGT